MQPSKSRFLPVLAWGALCAALAVGFQARPALSAGSTYYVAAAGSDGNTGSQASPFREIRKALAAAGPGDTILVGDGSYKGFDVSGRNGTPGFPITVRATGANAVVTPTTDRSDNRDTILVTSSSYVVLDGLRSFNANRAAVRVDSSQHITVRNGTFGNNATWGIFTDFSDDLLLEGNECYGSGTQHGIYTSNSGDRPVIRGNRCHDNYACGIHMNGDLSSGGDGLISGGLVEDNVIYNNGAGGGSGINMDGVQDTIVRNNLLYNNRASGISCFQIDGASGPKGMRILNNTVDQPLSGRWALQFTSTAGLNVVRNNILYHANSSRGGLLCDTADVANVDSDYNVMDRVSADGGTVMTLSQWQSQGHEPNSLSAAPAALWVNQAAADYHLPSSSPAVDRAPALADVTDDLEHNPRPSGAAYDLGCYELPSGGTPPVTPPATTGLQINCGGSAYTSATSGAWAADSSFTGGSAYAVSNAISGTSDPALYQSERYGSFSYNLPVANGTYTLKLHFAETYYRSAGQRVFNVSVNGTPALTNFDVVAAGGPNTAVVKSIPVSVTNGAVNVTLQGVVNVPILSAIQLTSGSTTPAPPAAPTSLSAAAGNAQVALSWTASTGAASYTVKRSTVSGGPYSTVTSSVTGISYTDTAVTNGTKYYYVVTAIGTGGESASSNEASATPAAPSAPGTTALQINCGGPAYTSPTTGPWQADTSFTGGATYAVGNAISGTGDPALYQSERYGSFSYSLPASNGTYTLNLHFAETYYTAAGQRVFNVLVNGAPALTNFDVVAAGGPNTAVVKSIPVSVTNGAVNITVQAVVNVPILSAIQLVSTSGSTPPPPPPATGGTTLRINCGGPAYTSPTTGSWQADAYFTGGSTYAVANAISGTGDPALYQSERYDNFSYSLPVANGTYMLKLHFAETYYTAAGKRVFNVSVNGTPALTNFDVVAAGGANTAVVKSLPVSVTNGVVNVTLQGVVNVPILSAIELTPGG